MLAEFCSTRLARYKIPRQLHLTDDIPRTPVGKPDYRWAKRLATESSPQDAADPRAERT